MIYWFQDLVSNATCTATHRRGAFLPPEVLLSLTVGLTSIPSTKHLDHILVTMKRGQIQRGPAFDIRMIDVDLI